jgi:hypothetical protein
MSEPKQLKNGIFNIFGNLTMTKGVYDHGLTPILGRGVAAMYQFGRLPHQIFFLLPSSKLFFAQMGKNIDTFLAIFFCRNYSLEIVH